MQSLKDLIEERKSEKGQKRHATHEWQAFAYRLAAELEDLGNLKMYLRLAKTQERKKLEECRRFVLDSNVGYKKALFLWKMKELGKIEKSRK